MARRMRQKFGRVLDGCRGDLPGCEESDVCVGYGYDVGCVREIVCVRANGSQLGSWRTFIGSCVVDLFDFTSSALLSLWL
jgi:hypothetical protein